MTQQQGKSKQVKTNELKAESSIISQTMFWTPLDTRLPWAEARAMVKARAGSRVGAGFRTRGKDTILEKVLIRACSVWTEVWGPSKATNEWQASK